MNRFYKLEATDIQASKKEVIRYLGYRALHQPDEVVDKMIDQSITELQKVLRPNLVWDEYDLTVSGNCCNVSGTEIKSEQLAKNLKGCSSVILFAGTLGSEVDKFIRTTGFTDSAKACVLQATGAMFIEEFVNRFNKKIEDEKKAEGLVCHKRYSPGYGDLPLETQKLFFSFLNCSKIGLTLMDTLIMAPEKSVTAFIGIEK
ncbi:MAG: hypothetical protein MJ185_06110 [Treponema sp.]|nr:hypothetical protein [Treponema sp.]